MDLHQKFIFTEEVTEDQLRFFDQYGFIHFKHFYSLPQIREAIQAIEQLQNEWIQNGTEKINGVPIKFGKDENGKPIVQRFAFSSLHSPYLHEMLQDKRIMVLRKFLGEDARIGENEKDGLVINHFVNTGASNFTKLGWHTDGLRDLLLHLKLNPMLNVGVYLDDSPIEKGGLRILPGTHNQNLYSMLFRKKYFVDNTPDENEISLEAEAGDLTIHSGRLWHRVALASVEGVDSRRRIMYFPIIRGKYKPKSHRSPTPIYHKFQGMLK